VGYPPFGKKSSSNVQSHGYHLAFDLTGNISETEQDKTQLVLSAYIKLHMGFHFGTKIEDLE